MAKKRRSGRSVVNLEGGDFLARRFAELGVQSLPSRWISIAASKLPKALRENDDVQEEVARGMGMLAALGFGLEAGSQRAFEGAIEEALEEIGKQASMHPEGDERRGFVRSRMSRLREEIERKLKTERPGKSIIDAIAEDLSGEEQAEWQKVFYTFPRARRKEHLRDMEKRRGTASRIRLLLETPELEQYEAFLVLLEQAPPLKQEERGMLDRMLSKLGASAKDFGPDGCYSRGLIDSMEQSGRKRKERIRRLSKLGY